MSMKKCFLGFGVALALGACASGDGLGMTQSMAATYLENQCHSYLEEQAMWSVAKVALGSKSETVKNELCDCASEEAARNMTTSQMISLANPEKREAVLVEMIAPTVTACYSRMSVLF